MEGKSKIDSEISGVGGGSAMLNTSTVKVEIVHTDGIHAKPSMDIAEVANEHTSEITIRKLCTGQSADAKSVMQVITLESPQGTRWEITAHGQDSETACFMLSSLQYFRRLFE